MFKQLFPLPHVPLLMSLLDFWLAALPLPSPTALQTTAGAAFWCRVLNFGGGDGSRSPRAAFQLRFQRQISHQFLSLKVWCPPCQHNSRWDFSIPVPGLFFAPGHTLAVGSGWAPPTDALVGAACAWSECPEVLSTPWQQLEGAKSSAHCQPQPLLLRTCPFSSLFHNFSWPWGAWDGSPGACSSLRILPSPPAARGVATSLKKNQQKVIKKPTTLCSLPGTEVPYVTALHFAGE